MGSLTAKPSDLLSNAFSNTFSAVSPYRRTGLRIAWTLVAVVIMLGVYVLFWLWQIKDLGVTIDWTGELLSVEPGTMAAYAGLRPGDHVSFEDFQRLKQISAGAQAGQLIQALVWHGNESRTVTLQALPGPMPRALSLSIEALAGIMFAGLGIAPLIARRRGLSLWLFFLSTELAALFLIADVPRAFHMKWIEIIAYIALPLFPATLFHFHTLFPQPRLGRLRGRFVILVYALAAILLPLDLISLWNYSFYLSDGWQWIITIYQGAVLLACLGLLVRTFATTREPKVRAQLRTITLCSGLGLLIPALLLIPMVIFNLDTNDMLKSVAVFSALAVPVGYAYSMIRYNLLIEEVLWRPSLIRVIYSSLFGLGLVLLVVFALPKDKLLTGSSILAAWAGVVLIVIILAGVQEWVGQWVEAHLFKGRSYIDLLASATDELQRFHNLDEYVRFFTEVLPARLDSVGSLVFLSLGQGDPLVLSGHSLSLRLSLSTHEVLQHVQDMQGMQGKQRVPTLSSGSELHTAMRTARGPVFLHTLLMPHTPPFPEQDEYFLQAAKAAHVELLLPLVSSQQKQLIGLVALGAKETDEAYSSQELTALSALARTASISAENVLRMAELEQEREYTATLAHSVSASQEQERKRISRDLHDSTLQDLGAVSRALSDMREQVQEMLATCEEQQLELESHLQLDARLDAPWNMNGIGKNPGLSGDREQIMVMLARWQIKLGMLLGEDARVGSLSQTQIDATTSANTNLSVPTPTPTSIPALTPSLSALPGPPPLGSQPSIEGLMSYTRETSQRVRSICNDLHPTYLDSKLGVALKDSVAQFCKLNPAVRIEIDVSGDEVIDISDAIKVACKEVMEQAINNALVHAKPARITIGLSFSPEGEIALAVTDDGSGFEPRP